MSTVEGLVHTSDFVSNAHPVGGRRMKKVSAKAIRRTLKKLGMKPKGRVVLRGGDKTDPAGAVVESAATPAAGGRRRRHGGRTKRGKKGLLHHLC